eukprot:CAMPEP_0206005252 /NCGR_PEP_ID=MMETSP1464-20131121/4467_1 /ASSEMBLY_ACC=CAM_ASM_001124 /TAXON_ID=119497 /ORGANISM="Exanthemachrysis gayraliae, Strain RCC1523" /LENGTH=46 /DNA_ID= /DNA_START= /DNA_END= /DNA_ORIENTATION=
MDACWPRGGKRRRARLRRGPPQVRTLKGKMHMIVSMDHVEASGDGM